MSRRARLEAIDRLCRVNGIGMATAERLVDELGVTTIAEVIEAESQGLLAGLPGVTEKHRQDIRKSAGRILVHRPRSEAEPKRVPEPVTSGASRATAGCLGLFVFPWFMTSLFFSFVSAGMPLTGESGVAGIVMSIVMMALFVPMATVLGGFTLSAFRRAAGRQRNLEIPMKAAGALGLSIAAIFLFTAASSIVSSVLSWIGGAVIEPGSIVSTAGLLGFLFLVGHLIRRVFKRDRKEKERRRHDRPPRPPWANPLARTRRTSMLGEALADQYNVITQGALVALSIVMWNPLPALIGGGLELFWLALAPDSKWFRDRVEAKHRAMAEEQARERREEQIEYLTEEQLERHEEMLHIADAARDAMAAAQYPFDTGKVDHLVDHHLWLMELENYYTDQRNLEQTTGLVEQMERLREERASASGRMEEALTRRLDVLQRRLDQIDRLADRLDEVSEQRRNLEDAVRLIAESALSASGSEVATEIDDVLTNLQATEEVVLDFQAEEDELEREIEEAAAAVAA
jgi:hypothetical protein